MLKDRLQILIEPEQRRRLDAEARRRGISIGALVREAIDSRLGASDRATKVAAAERLTSGEAAFVPPDELRRALDERFDERYRRLLRDRDGEH